LRIKKLPEKMLRQHDPDLISFYNINTPEDLATAQDMLAKLDLNRQVDVETTT
jgi:hypothetical protein